MYVFVTIKFIVFIIDEYFFPTYRKIAGQEINDEDQCIDVNTADGDNSLRNVKCLRHLLRRFSEELKCGSKEASSNKEIAAIIKEYKKNSSHILRIGKELKTRHGERKEKSPQIATHSHSERLPSPEPSSSPEHSSQQKHSSPRKNSIHSTSAQQKPPKHIPFSTYRTSTLPYESSRRRDLESRVSQLIPEDSSHDIHRAYKNTDMETAFSKELKTRRHPREEKLLPPQPDEEEFVGALDQEREKEKPSDGNDHQASVREHSERLSAEEEESTYTNTNPIENEHTPTIKQSPHNPTTLGNNRRRNGKDQKNKNPHPPQADASQPDLEEEEEKSMDVNTRASPASDKTSRRPNERKRRKKAGPNATHPTQEEGKVEELEEESMEAPLAVKKHSIEEVQRSDEEDQHALKSGSDQSHGESHPSSVPKPTKNTGYLGWMGYFGGSASENDPGNGKAPTQQSAHKEPHEKKAHPSNTPNDSSNNKKTTSWWG